MTTPETTARLTRGALGNGQAHSPVITARRTGAGATKRLLSRHIRGRSCRCGVCCRRCSRCTGCRDGCGGPRREHSSSKLLVGLDRRPSLEWTRRWPTSRSRWVRLAWRTKASPPTGVSSRSMTRTPCSRSSTPCGRSALRVWLSVEPASHCRRRVGHSCRLRHGVLPRGTARSGRGRPRRTVTGGGGPFEGPPEALQVAFHVVPVEPADREAALFEDGGDVTAEMASAGSRRCSGLRRLCHRGTWGSGERPCSTKCNVPPGRRTRSISPIAVTRSSTLHSVHVDKAASTSQFSGLSIRRFMIRGNTRLA